MRDYSGVFKSYDIRSIYDDPMDHHFCRSLGKAMGQYLVRTYGDDASCVVGSDCRAPNAELFVALVSGLEAGGCTDWCLLSAPVMSREGQSHPYGVASTSLVYWTVFEQFDLGISLTASHNPPEWVGMKNADRSASLLPSADLKEMITTYEEYPYAGDSAYQEQMIAKLTAQMKSPDPRVQRKIDMYYTDILLPVFTSLEKKYTLAVDYSGGAACGLERYYIEKLASETALDVVHYNDKADALCSEHLSDTSAPANYQKVGALVREHGSDLGVMFDGDADRLGVVDEHGEMVLGDRLVALIGTSIVEAHGGGNIVYDITSTNDIRHNVERVGGSTIISRTGYRYVKALMKEHGALFGGESSGHLLFPETGYAESPLLALGYILKCMDRYESLTETLSEMVSYYKPPLKNFHVENKDGVIEKITQLYSEFDLDFTDGVRVNGPDRWFIVRKSNSEPLLRVFVEGQSPQQCADLFKQIEAVIAEIE